MYNLFLDDIRQPIDAYNLWKTPVHKDLKWVICKNYRQFVDCITNNGLPEIVSFDHDLADIHYKIKPDMWRKFSSAELQVEHTGYDAVKWMCQYCIDNKKELPICYVHTQNTVGGDNIREYIRFYQRAKERQII